MKYIIQTKDLIKGSLYYYRIIFHLHIDIRGGIENFQGFIQATLHIAHIMEMLVEQLLVTTYYIHIIYPTQLLQDRAKRGIVEIQDAILPTGEILGIHILYHHIAMVDISILVWSYLYLIII